MVLIPSERLGGDQGVPSPLAIPLKKYYPYLATLPHLKFQPTARVYKPSNILRTLDYVLILTPKNNKPFQFVILHVLKASALCNEDTPLRKTILKYILVLSSLHRSVYFKSLLPEEIFKSFWNMLIQIYTNIHGAITSLLLTSLCLGTPRTSKRIAPVSFWLEVLEPFSIKRFSYLFNHLYSIEPSLIGLSVKSIRKSLMSSLFFALLSLRLRILTKSVQALFSLSRKQNRIFSLCLSSKTSTSALRKESSEYTEREGYSETNSAQLSYSGRLFRSSTTMSLAPSITYLPEQVSGSLTILIAFNYSLGGGASHV